MIRSTIPLDDSFNDCYGRGMKKLNATAIRDTTCTRCKAPIAKGARCAMFRERALSSHEAQHSGLYPMRRWCEGCASESAVPWSSNPAIIEGHWPSQKRRD